MFPMVHAVIYIAGFRLLLFWRTVILCRLALQYLAIVPCLCGNISWIRIQSLCSLFMKLCSNRNVISPLIIVNRNTTMTELSWIYMRYSISCITKSTALKISIECQWFQLQPIKLHIMNPITFHLLAFLTIANTELGTAEGVPH